jgi:hypothetical protein
MKKLRLELDELRVESFETVAPARSRGTVRGQDATENTWCGQDSCDGTCYTDCWGLGCPGGGGGSDACNPSQWPCSLDGPLATQCDLSCEFECTGETCEGATC